MKRNKLDAEDIPMIMALVAERERLIRESRELSNAKIGEKFGVHGSQINRITGGRAWKDIRRTNERNR